MRINFFLLAIPFFIAAVAFLTAGFVGANPTFVILGYCFLAIALFFVIYKNMRQLFK